MAHPIYEYMHNPEMIAYANNPFDSVNRAAIATKILFPAIRDPSIKLKPPYVIYHKSLVVDPGNDHKLTVAEINDIMWIRKFCTTSMQIE